MRNVMSAVTLAACAALLSCGAQTMSPVQSEGTVPTARAEPARRDAFVAGHLYVSTAGYGGFTGPLARYRLTNGVPATKPDLTYPDTLLGQFSVDRSGRLYGIRFGPDRNGGLLHVLVFPPNSARATRSLTPSQPYNSFFPGIVGAEGYIYLAGGQTSPNTETNCASNFILVYAPAARRQEPWTTCAPATATTYFNALWMTLDAGENLYVPAYDAHSGRVVDVYADPTTNPTIVRTLSGPSLAGTLAVADDGEGNLYATATNGDKQSYVATYSDSANGNVKPLRRLFYSGAQYQANVAVDDRYLYVGGYEAVFVFDKTASGHAKPMATLPFPAANYYDPSVAIGP
jgi:hypothetical protein